MSDQPNQLRPDAIIEELGGCGLYQWRLNILLHVLKTVVCFSIYSMIVIGATPPWICADDVTCQNTTALDSHKYSVPLNTTQLATDVSVGCREKQCVLENSSMPCTSYKFLGDANTFVSEVNY